MNANAQHNSESNEHYTPSEIVEASRAVLGRIDLDPCSCALANTVVKASVYYDAEALDRDWCRENGEPARVFVNPPGGKLNKDYEPLPRNAEGKQLGPGLSTAAVYWWKLMYEYDVGHVDQAIYICFSLNVLQNAQKDGVRPPYAFPFVVPAQRLKFWNEDTSEGTGAPSQPNAVVYVPPKDGYRRAQLVAEFVAAFSRFGAVRV